MGAVLSKVPRNLRDIKRYSNNTVVNKNGPAKKAPPVVTGTGRLAEAQRVENMWAEMFHREPRRFVGGGIGEGEE